MQRIVDENEFCLYAEFYNDCLEIQEETYFRAVFYYKIKSLSKIISLHKAKDPDITN